MSWQRADWSRFSPAYKKAILSEHFKQLREVLLREIGKCEVCGVKYVFRKVSLTLHHKHYRTLGKETKADVMLVCRGCHREIHGKPRKRQRESRALLRYIQGK